MFLFYTPWKHQKTFGFLVFSGGKKWNIGQKLVKEVDRNNSNLPMIVNSVHIFNSQGYTYLNKPINFQFLAKKLGYWLKASCHFRYLR